MSRASRKLASFVLASLASSAILASAGAQDEGPKGPPPSPVRVAAVREDSLAPRKKVFGELRAARRTTVAAEEGGIVREVFVREGQPVAAGAVVARLDDARLRLAIGANEASLAAARATVGEREAQYAREERDLELLNRAAAQGGTNPRELADAESEMTIARAQVVQARAAVGVIEEQGALLAKRRADLEVRAPFAGVVTRRHTEAGAWLAEGGAVVDLVDNAHLEGWFDIPQELYEPALGLVRDAARESKLAAIDIRTSLGGVVHTASIRIVPEIDERARTFHVVADIDNADGRLAAGLALHAFVPQGPPQKWTLVPKDALVYQGSNASLYLVRDGVAVPVPVRVAFPVGDLVALDGAALAAGSLVVVEGNERLMPMGAVAPIAEEKAK
jgi:RND family efflux transporter MFP subunit